MTIICVEKDEAILSGPYAENTLYAILKKSKMLKTA